MSSSSVPKGPPVLHFFSDEACTKEAVKKEGVEFPLLINESEIVSDSPVKQTIWAKFVPFKPNHIFISAGKIEVLGDGRLIDGSKLPSQMRAYDKFSFIIEWFPREGTTVETLEALSVRINIPGNVVAPA